MGSNALQPPLPRLIHTRMLTPLSAIAPAGATRTAGPSYRTNAPTIVPPSPSFAIPFPPSLQPPPPTNTSSDTLPLALSRGSSPGMFDAPSSLMRSRDSPPPELHFVPLARAQKLPTDTIQTPLLVEYGIVINTTFNVIICLCCQSIINPKKFRYHFGRYHKELRTPTTLDADFEEQVLRQYPGLTFQPDLPTCDVPAVYGLQPPIPADLCPACRRCYTTKKSLRQNLCPGQEAVPTHAQRFIQNSKSPWFSVQLPPPLLPPQRTRWASYQSQRQGAIPAGAPNALTDNFRVLHQFLQRNEWLSKIDGQKHEDLMPLASYSVRDPVIGTLHKHIHAFFASTQQGSNDNYLRRLVATRPAEEHDQLKKRHHTLINSRSQANYARIIAALVVFIHRVSSGGSSYTFPVPSNISSACDALIRALSPDPTNDAEDELEEMVLPDSDDDSDTGDLPNPQYRPAPAAIDEVQTKLRHLLYAIYTQLPQGELKGDFFSPATHFILISSLKPNQQWLPITSITHNIAALLYTGRTIFSSKILEICSERKPITTSKAFEDVERYFEERSEAILPRLYLLKRGLSSLRSAEQSTILFNAPDVSGTSAIIGDKLLKLSDLADLHRRATREIKDEIDKLTFHHPLFVLDEDQFIHDSPRDLSSGYSFTNDPRNSWNQHPSLLEHILNTPELFAQYGYLDRQGKISWIPAKIAAALEQIYDLQTKIMCNVILSYGEPARGTELASHLLSNVSGGSIRNFFVLMNLPVLRASFSKTTSMQGADKVICRIPYLPLGRQLIRFLVYLRPLYTEWQRFLHPYMEDNAKQFLFAGLRQPVQSVDISTSLARYLSKEVGAKLTLRSYRQYMAFITGNNQDVFAAAEKVPHGIYEQFGHSADVNVQHYGHDSRLPSGMNMPLFVSTARVSAVFHMLFGHSGELLEHLERGKGRALNIISRINAILNRGIPAMPLTGTTSAGPSQHLAVDDIAAALKAQLIPDLCKQFKDLLSESNASAIELFSPNATATSSVDHSFHVHPFLVAKLRELYPHLGQNVGFRNKEQAIVTQLMYLGQRHVLYVSPTGSGKTTPGMLAAKFLRPGKSLVWLLPLLAMHEQSQNVSTSSGLTWEKWSNATLPTTLVDNIFATIDQATHVSFQRFIKTKLAHGTLGGILIDEVHLVATHASFRPVMDLLEWLAGHPVQIVLMTATLPPLLEKPLLERIGITSAVVVRTTTARPNISFRVVRAQVPLDDAVDQTYRSILQASPSNRVLLFCLTVREAEKYAQRFGIPSCHSSIDTPELYGTLQRFRMDLSIRGLATTSILGVGLDVSTVTHTIHVGFPRDAIAFTQEAGRAGRGVSTTPAYAVVILPPTIAVPDYPSPDFFGVQVLYETLISDAVCRRVPLQIFLDGKADSCSTLPGMTHFCDVCERQSRAPFVLNHSDAVPNSLLLSAAHSRKSHAPKFQYIAGSDEVERLHTALLHFSTACISCAILHSNSPQDYPPHLFRDCQYSPSPVTQPAAWLELRSSLQFPLSTCYQCGVSQRVCISYSHSSSWLYLLPPIYPSYAIRTPLAKWYIFTNTTLARSCAHTPTYPLLFYLPYKANLSF